MHMEFDLEEYILLTAMGGEDNPLRDIPEDAGSIPASKVRAWSVWLWEQLGKAFAGKDLSLNLDTYAETVTNSADNPLKQLPNDAETVPVEIFRQTVQWMAKAIAENIKTTTASQRP